MGMLFSGFFSIASRGHVTVRIPSDESEDSIWFSLWPAGSMYRRTKWREMYPCSSSFSSCFPSTTRHLSTYFTEISSGANCCTSRLIWNLSLVTFTVEPLSRVLATQELCHGRT
uniref:Uncharacterized protein n=1 Tax=Anopheles albimanus TaxID=7167 RepID=A0A182FXU0_ANOAL